MTTFDHWRAVRLDRRQKLGGRFRPWAEFRAPNSKRSQPEAVMSEDRFPGSALRAIQLQIGAQRIAGYESPGTARAILLVHGNSSSSRVWQKQLEGPLGGKYRLIAIDLPGHGASSAPPNPEQDYSGAGYSACIAAVVRELELRDA